MAKKKPKRSSNQPRARQQAFTEDRRAEAVTVAWMLCVLATLLAEVTGGLARLVLAWAGTQDLPQTFQAVPGLMLFSALLTGILSLILLPLAYRLRRTPPPAVITAFAATVAAVPLVICFWHAMR